MESGTHAAAQVRARTALIAVTLILALVSPAGADETPGLEKALKAFAEGDWKSVVEAAEVLAEDEAYDKALALDEKFLDAHKNLAILCHTMSNRYRNVERIKKSMHHYERYFALGGHDPKLEQTYRTTRSFLESQGMLR